MTIEILCDLEQMEINGKTVNAASTTGAMQFQITGCPTDADMACFMGTIAKWAEKHKVPLKHVPL